MSFENNLAYGFGMLALATRSNFGCFPAYSTINYGDTFYCDLDQPTGLSSWVDGGYALNKYGYLGNGQFMGGYSNGYTGFAPMFGFGGLGFGGFGFGGFGGCHMCCCC